VETMMRLGLRHQAELYALPLCDQLIEHTTNLFTGAYEQPRKGKS